MSDLLSVLVGGAIGIVAGVVGPYFIQRVKEKADIRQKRVEKFEELVASVSEHYHWIGALRFFAIAGQGDLPSLSLSPITKIEAISSTYLPQFADLVIRADAMSSRATSNRFPIPVPSGTGIVVF